MAAQPMMCTDVQLHVRCELPGQACAARAAVASIVDMLGRQFCVDTHRGPSVQPVLMPSSWLSPSPCTASIYMKAECMTGTALPVDARPQKILIAFGAKCPRTIGELDATEQSPADITRLKRGRRKAKARSVVSRVGFRLRQRGRVHEHARTQAQGMLRPRVPPSRADDAFRETG